MLAAAAACMCCWVRACREALQQFTPRQLRLMFIMSPWNKTISYGATMCAEMRAKESALKNFFQNVDVAIREGSKNESGTSGKWQVRLGKRACKHMAYGSSLGRYWCSPGLQLVREMHRNVRLPTPLWAWL